MKEREFRRAVHGWSLEEEIKWEINQVEQQIDEEEFYCDKHGLSYNTDEMKILKARFAKLQTELKEIKNGE